MVGGSVLPVKFLLVSRESAIQRSYYAIQGQGKIALLYYDLGKKNGLKISQNWIAVWKMPIITSIYAPIFCMTFRLIYYS